MLRYRFTIYFLFVVSACFFLPLTFAQESTCSAIVETAISVAQDSCTELERNVVCYGHNQLEAQGTDEVPLADFAEPGDTESVLELYSLSTSALDENTEQWGVALLSLQADLPDTLPGQNVTFVVFGNSSIEATESEALAQPFQAFYFSSGIGNTSCEEAPQDGLLIQAPEETTVHFLINGIEVEVGSTTYVQAAEDGSDGLTFNTLDGTIAVTAGDTSQTVEPGYRVTAREDEPVEEAEAYDYDAMSRAPIGLLPDPISIPIVIPGDQLAGWIETVVTLEEGQVFEISATGEVNVFTDCVELRDRGDIPADYDCDLMTTGPDARLGAPTDAPDPGAYPTIEYSVGALIGRVGEGEIFLVGDGGTFTAEQAGVLQLRVNDDNLRQDNSGEFIAVVIVEE